MRVCVCMCVLCMSDEKHLLEEIYCTCWTSNTWILECYVNEIGGKMSYFNAFNLLQPVVLRENSETLDRQMTEPNIPKGKERMFESKRCWIWIVAILFIHFWFFVFFFGIFLFSMSSSCLLCYYSMGFVGIP